MDVIHISRLSRRDSRPASILSLSEMTLNNKSTAVCYKFQGHICSLYKKNQNHAKYVLYLLLNKSSSGGKNQFYFGTNLSQGEDMEIMLISQWMMYFLYWWNSWICRRGYKGLTLTLGGGFFCICWLACHNKIFRRVKFPRNDCDKW